MWQELFSRPLLNSLVFLYSVLPFAKLGLAIILLTILIRIILYPLTMQSIKQQQQLKKIQPELDQLKKKHGKNKQKYQEEMVKFYAKHKINPVMGCLPLLIQMPILIALYQVFHMFSGANLEQINALLYSFIPPLQAISSQFLLWDLSKPDPTYLLAILAGVTQLIQTKMIMTTSTDPNQKAMNQTALLMPLMIIFFSAGLPAALPLYWIASTVAAILQTYIMRSSVHAS